MFAWIGLTSIGGGRAAYVYEIFVERRAWLTRDEFLPGYTLSQLLPGPTIANLAVFLGNGFRGAAGAAWGLLAVLLPGGVAILALSTLYFEYGVGPSLNAALRGMGAAVAGFLCVTAARMSRGRFGGRGAPWVTGLTFAAVGLFRLNTVLVILLVGGLSLYLNRPGQEGRPKESQMSPEVRE
jgi:chromate transporter